MRGTSNMWCLVARVGDIQLQKKCVLLSVATTEPSRDDKTETHWHRVKVLGEKFVASVSQNVKKGMLLSIQGPVRNDSFTNRDDGREVKMTTLYAKNIEILTWPEEKTS